jgi:hypothetical protein
MSDSPAQDCGDPDAHWVIALGVIVGVAALSLSMVGLLGRLNVTSAAACLLLSVVAGVTYLRRLGARPRTWSAWLTAPLLVPSALAAFLPPYTWDEVAYGAALPRDFARAGHIFYNSDYGAYAAFPANYEALVTASLLLTKDVWLTQLLNVALALAMAMSAALLARRLGVTGAAAPWAGLLVLCAPALIGIAPLTKNDVAAAFFQTLAVLALGCLEPRRDLGVLLSGSLLGLSLGTKYSSLHFLLAFAPLAIWFIARSAASRPQALRRVLLWVVSLTLLGSPWYLRNLLLLSNPTYPFFNDWLGAANGFTREQSELLREAFFGLADINFATGTLTTFVTRVVEGFGVLPAALLLPGALLAVWPRRQAVGVLVTGTAIGYLLLTLFTGTWAPRYFLSLLVLASALAALLLHGLGSAFSRVRPTARWLPLLVLAPAFVAAAWGAYPAWRENVRAVRALQAEGRKAFVENRAPYHAVARWLNTHLGPHDRVAIGFNIQPFYYLDRRYYHIHPLTQGELVSAQTPEQVEAALRGVGATFLAFSGADGTYFEPLAPKITAYRERLWQAQRRLRQAGRLRLIETVDGVRILRLENSAEAGGDAAAPASRAVSAR